MKNNIFVIGGGTGGHLFPAIAILEEMEQRGYNTTLITDDRCIKYLQNTPNIKVKVLKISRFSSNIFSNFLTIYLLIKAILQSLRLFYKTKPLLVIGFGGYVTFPTLIAAKICNIPIMLHEQNCFLGKVNKIFANYAKILCLPFENVSNMPLDFPEEKIIITGNPIRKEILENFVSKKHIGNKFKILVTGGSQGAKFLSHIITEALHIVQKQLPEMKIEIVQQCRTEDIETITKLCKEYKINAEISDFFYNMPELLSSSDILIGRAGASTIAEIIATAKPSILIPYPFAAENHQFFNAEMIVKHGGGWCFEQKNLTSQILAKKILEIISDKKIIQDTSQALKKLQKDSANIIADTAEKIIGNFKEKS